MSKPRALLSWSSGKDCAWALHILREQNEIEVVGLVTTFNEVFSRVAMHGVRMDLVKAHARAVGLPLWSIPLPWPCTNQVYEDRMAGVTAQAIEKGITLFAFGNLHLQDVRDYRERQLSGTGLKPIFPIWGSASDTPALADQRIQSGRRAVVTCVDPKQLNPRFAGAEFGTVLLSELPPSVDPCGERGEFHTFCYDAPSFRHPVNLRLGEIVERDGFVFADIEAILNQA